MGLASDSTRPRGPAISSNCDHHVPGVSPVISSRTDRQIDDALFGWIDDERRHGAGEAGQNAFQLRKATNQARHLGAGTLEHARLKRRGMGIGHGLRHGMAYPIRRSADI